MYTEDKNEADKIVGAVMGRIAKSRLQRARALAAFHLTLIAATVISAMPVFRLITDRASQSGFFEYASLAFSDWGYVVSTWNAYLLSIAESAPIISTAMFISVILIFAYSIRGAVRDISTLRSVSMLRSI